MTFYRRYGKRAFDIVVIVLTAPLLLPVMGIAALLVRARLGVPVLFTQERPGQEAKPFRLIKFRSMTDGRDAEGALLPDAERLTPFGRFLRASSLDELPELWNILKGEMSLVGPRPLLMQYVPLYSPEQWRRHEMRPGLTGLAQTSGRNALSWDEKFALDVWYVENCSLALDLKILLLTVHAVVAPKGISAEGEATMPVFTGNPPTDGRE